MVDSELIQSYLLCSDNTNGLPWFFSQDEFIAMLLSSNMLRMLIGNFRVKCFNIKDVKSLALSN